MASETEPIATDMKMFIDGEWVRSDGGETQEAINPATGEPIAQTPDGTRTDARRAIEEAR